MTTIIHIDAEQPLAILDERTWTKGAFGDDSSPVCLHGAIRLCQPQPGDAMLIEQVANGQGWGTRWNDAKGTTEAMVRDRLAQGVDITDADLRVTFGPQWSAVMALVRRAAVLTPDEADLLAAAWGSAWDAAWIAAGGSAGAAAWGSAWVAAWGSARAAAGAAAGAAARDAARDAAMAAAGAVIAWDLATVDGPFTFAMRDLLMGPWVEVCGLPDGLLTAEQVAAEADQ